jgi:Ca2+-binding EF-hand superfamily protein
MLQRVIYGAIALRVMGQTLSARLDSKALQQLQSSTAFTKDELLEIYSQFRFLSDNQKTITRQQFEMGLAAAGLTRSPGASHTEKAHAAKSSAVDFMPPSTSAQLAERTQVVSLRHRLYEVMYLRAHGTAPPSAAAADKGLNFDEFCAAVSAFVAPDPDTQLEALFRLFDESGDDYITEGELKRALFAVNALLELPEISTDASDDAEEVRKAITTYARDLVSAFGEDGRLTLPQFKQAVQQHPEVGAIGRRLVVDACAEFFHVGTPSTVSSDAISPQRPQDRTLAGSYLTVNQGDGGEVPRSPGISRRGSFAIVPPDAPAFVFDKNASDENTLNDTGSQLASSSVAHVLVHCYPRETKQQICFVAQRHRYEFTHRPDDRILHFIVVEYAKGSPAPTAEATLALHEDFVQSVAMGDSKRRVHVAIKAAAVEDVAKGLDEDELRALIKRFLQANPANIVRLPVHGSVGFHAAFVNHFANLALITGHGYDLVTPDTAAHAVVRRPRNYVFCAERSKTSERAARVIGLMLNPRHGDVCVVETIWHVGMQSFGHAYNDDSTEWKDHLGSLRAGSVRLAEHFKGQVAREAGRAVAALKSNQRPAVYDHRESNFDSTVAECAHRIAVGTMEEDSWSKRLLQVLQRNGYVPTATDEHVPSRSDTVVVLGLESRSMAQKLYASTMSHLRQELHSLDAARSAVSFVFVN